MPVRIAVLASGGGSNLQALIDRFHGQADPPVRVELVGASRPGIGALERAQRAGIPTFVAPAPKDSDDGGMLLDRLRTVRIDLIVLAGYLQRIPIPLIEEFRGRILNVHPALLPAFGGKGMYGIRVHQAVLAAGTKVTGATVHLVDENYDEGPILVQWPVPVLPDDTPESLAARVLRVEHLLLPAAVEAFVSGAAVPPLAEPLTFELERRLEPAADSVARLAAATCKPISLG